MHVAPGSTGLRPPAQASSACPLFGPRDREAGRGAFLRRAVAHGTAEAPSKPRRTGRAVREQSQIIGNCVWARSKQGSMRSTRLAARVPCARQEVDSATARNRRCPQATWSSLKGRQCQRRTAQHSTARSVARRRSRATGACAAHGERLRLCMGARVAPLAWGKASMAGAARRVGTPNP